MEKFLGFHCPCGWGGGNGHARQHFLWSRGVPLPKSLRAWPYIEVTLKRPDWGWFLWRVRPQDPNPGHKFAYKMARLMKKENHYDFTGWPDNKRDFGEWIKKEPAFFALVEGGYAIGFVIVEKTTEYAAWDVKTKEEIHYEGEPKLKICQVWVAHLLRRLGVATTLIKEVTAIYKTSINEVVWGVPFSESGEALAFSLTKRPQIYIG